MNLNLKKEDAQECGRGSWIAAVMSAVEKSGDESTRRVGQEHGESACMQYAAASGLA